MLDLKIAPSKLDVWDAIIRAKAIAVAAAEAELWLASFWDPDRGGDDFDKRGSVGQLVRSVVLIEQELKYLKRALQRSHQK